jgi:hypothetical protein
MRQVLWERADGFGFVAEPVARFRQTLATVEALRRATTWGQVRSATLAGWAHDAVARLEQELSAVRGAAISDDEPWDYAELAESITDGMPLPHDASSTMAWLGPDLFGAHLEVGGASPAGHADGYRVRDPDAFLVALQVAGFEPVHRPGFLQELFEL